MKKSNRKGFTLVELVVVIAIIGILAAILVPTMMNYVKKAKLKSANSNAKLVYNTVNNCAADLVVDGDTGDIDSEDPKAVSTMGGTSASALEKAVYEALKDNGSNAGYAAWSIDSTTYDVICAQWSDKNDGSSMLGQYPDPCTNANIDHANKQISSDKVTSWNS